MLLSDRRLDGRSGYLGVCDAGAPPCLQTFTGVVLLIFFLLQEGLDNDETTALKLHFASNSKIGDVQKQIKEAVLNPSTLEQGKLEMLMAKAEHSRLTGPDVTKLRDLLNRIQITKGMLEQAIVEKKEAQLIQSLNEGRELNLNPVILQQGERALQQIIERRNKRLMAKNAMSTPAMQAIALSSVTPNGGSNPQSELQEVANASAPAVKMSLMQEVSPFFSFTSPVIVSTLTFLSGKYCSAAFCFIDGITFSSRETDSSNSCSACSSARPRKCCF